ncbi:hypothetical protein M436DRAFT_80094 [Aureobasidium namibiae CBS 147.97]|uniref:Uncharacterized protein n=1 Tax=Aureobasidium namibiae CBS 147.97 TaxID=1043004 RepID=A0A074WR97_9PEZI
MASPSPSEQPSQVPHQESSLASPLPNAGIAQDPQVALAAGIEAKDGKTCIRLLDTHADALTRPGNAFDWLKDLFAIGLTSREVVDLIFEDAEQSPWICYELTSPAEHEEDATPYRSDYVQPARPHNSGKPTVAEVKRKISELCGLGGVIPTPHGRTLWNDDVKIHSFDHVASICYGSPAQTDR